MKRVRLMAGLAMLLLAPAALAQQPGGVPNAVQGFSKNRNQPIHVEAAALEVRDKQKVAVFSGNVKVVQGDTTMRCQSLHVFYEDNGATSPAGRTKPKQPQPSLVAAQPGPDGQQRIKRLEARGGVTVTQADQVATGETGIFDMKANTITLEGKVVVTRAKDVLRGQRLVVDMTSGVSRMDAGRAQDGKVEVLLNPSNSNLKPNAAPKDAAKPTPAQPMRLN